MADKRIIEFPETTSPGPDYYLVTDSASDGVKKILVSNVTAAAVEAAEDAATAAEAAAAALGNQVRQYDTRAQAQAAAIPAGVASIRVFSYAAGYPLSAANYVPGSSSGPAALQDANGNYWQLDLSEGRANAFWFGAKGDGVADDTAALQAAFDNCDDIALGKGTFKTTGPLTRRSPAGSDPGMFKSGLLLRGAGVLKTKILYAGTTNNIGVLTFTTADTTGVKFILGVDVRDLTIDRSGSATGVSGIVLTATWMPTMCRLVIQNMSQHGIFVPFRPDFDDSGSGGFSTGSDVYQDLYPVIEHCRFVSCSGWGVRFEGGNAASSHDVIYNQFVGCAGGGFYTEVGQGTVRGNVFTSCGTLNGDPALTGGMIVDAAPIEDQSPTPYGLRIIHNEFDTNEIQHLRLKSSVNAIVDRNRFISNVVSGVMKPAEHIVLGRISEGKSATRTTLIANAHRCSPADSVLASFWYDQESGSGTFIQDPLDVQSNTGRVKYTGLTSANGSIIIESGTMIVGPAPISATGSSVSLSNGNTANVCQINLPPGVYDIYGSVLFNPAATTNYSVRDISISTTSATHTQSVGRYFIERIPAGVVPANSIGGESLLLRVTVSTSTTYYLTARAFFTVSTMTADGIIQARPINR